MQKSSLGSQVPFEHSSWYKALTLNERMVLYRSGNVIDQPDGEEYLLSARLRLQRWQEQHPFTQEPYFAERLALNGLTEEELLAIVAESSETLQQRIQTLPEWLTELKHVLTTPAYFQMPTFAFSASEEEGSQKIGTFQRASFLKVLTPFLARSVERLRAGIQNLTTRYTHAPFEPETILKLLMANLPGHLLSQVNRTLTLELHVARLEGKLRGETPEERFQRFVEYLCFPENLQPFLEEYAPLARLLLTTAENWVRYSLEFLDHLCADWDEICQVMQPASNPGMLVGVQSGVGDLHRQGRSTLKLHFASGFRLVYKPKSLAIDIHFQQLLHWLNERGDHPAFRLLKLINRDLYGWSEFVRPENCVSREEIARFYERQGGYLALFYALEATDVHFENLIAAGEHPLMIDLESLFHPRMAFPLLQSVQSIGIETIGRSVLHVGLLPQRVWGDRERTGIDVSGLSGKGGQLTPRPVLQVEASGTDHMHYIRERIAVPGSDNLPKLGESAVNVLDYREQLIAGFTKIYRLLLSHRDELLAGPLQAFVQDEIRLIVRATQTYAQLLSESLHPDLLRDALDRDRFFDHLWAHAIFRPQLKQLIPAEIRDLLGGDIPMFTTRPNTRDVYTSSGECIPDFLEESSLASVTKRLLSFDEQDLSRQIWFIQGSLTTLLLGDGHAVLQGRHLPLVAPIQVTSSEALSARLLRGACTVGDRLCDLALYSEHGANWIGLTYINEREWVLSPAGADLYGGASGIALFLAYLGSVTGVEKYTSCAQAALAYIREKVKEIRGHLSALGGYDGWGCILYLYSHLSVLWQGQDLLDEARKIVELFPELVERDEVFDVMRGSAGGIAGLLSLYQVAPLPEILDAAIHCGERLLTSSTQCNTNMQENHSSTSSSQPLTGISHGAAGMAFNLLRLAKVSGEERFHQGAITAMKYERRVFSPEHQNWPDFRVDTSQEKDNAVSESSGMLAWCHGAPGIGLARLASLPYCDDAVIRSEIKTALKTTLAQGFGSNHSLCHGDLGNLETILTAACMLGDAHYRTAVEIKARALLDNIEQSGWKTGIPLGVEAPGLMTGIAGIGYELLRLAAPDQVPSVLILEPPK